MKPLATIRWEEILELKINIWGLFWTSKIIEKDLKRNVGFWLTTASKRLKKILNTVLMIFERLP